MEEFRDEEVQDETASKQGSAGASSDMGVKNSGSAADEQAGDVKAAEGDNTNTKAESPKDADTSDTSKETETTANREDTSDADDSASADDSAGSGSKASADSDPDAQTAGDTGKKSFFGKKKKDKKDQQIEDLTDRVQRQMAEFDNFRKRSEKEKAAMFEVGAKSVLEKILPTVDNFERGFANLTEEQKQDAFVQGMEKVYRQMLTSLEGIGVKPIEAVGQPFDPNFHNAVMHVEDEEAGENVVVEEFQKGYLYRDSVIRHSMVKVAN